MKPCSPGREDPKAGALAAPGVYVAPVFCRTYILLSTALFDPAGAGLQPPHAAMLSPPRAMQRADMGLLQAWVRTESWHWVHCWHEVMGAGTHLSLGICQAHGHLTHPGQMKSVDHFTAVSPSELSREEGWWGSQQGFPTARETMLTPLLEDATCSHARDTGTASCMKHGGFPTADKCCHASPSSAPSHSGARPGAMLLGTEPIPQTAPSLTAGICSPWALAKDTKPNARGWYLQRALGQKQVAVGRSAYFSSA